MIIDKNIKNTKDAFAKVFGSPGEAPIIIGLVKAFWPLLLICFLLGYIFRAIWIQPYLSQSQAGFILVVISILGFLFLFLGGRKLNNYLKGARGEEWVSNQLAFLDYNYSIFNGIKLENGKHNFDHVVLSPFGIFLVETKNWSGKISFSNNRISIDNKYLKKSPIKQLKDDALELINYLNNNNLKSIPVKPILCFLESELDNPVININGVIICSGESLIEVLSDELNDKIDSHLSIETEKVLLELV